MLGVALYTGVDTKIMLNQGLSSVKQSRIEHTLNVICVYLLLVTSVLLTILSILNGLFMRQNI